MLFNNHFYQRIPFFQRNSQIERRFQQNRYQFFHLISVLHSFMLFSNYWYTHTVILCLSKTNKYRSSSDFFVSTCVFILSVLILRKVGNKSVVFYNAGNIFRRVWSTINENLLKGIRSCSIIDFNFIDETVKRFKNRIGRSFKTALRKTHVKDFHFHDLRHTFASHLVMSGVDLMTVKEFLGHKTLSMTLRYAHLAPAHKVKAVNVLDSALNEQRAVVVGVT